MGIKLKGNNFSALRNSFCPCHFLLVPVDVELFSSAPPCSSRNYNLTIATQHKMSFRIYRVFHSSRSSHIFTIKNSRSNFTRALGTRKFDSDEKEKTPICAHTAANKSANLFELLAVAHGHQRLIIKFLLEEKKKNFSPSEIFLTREKEKKANSLQNLIRAMRIHLHAEEQSVFKSLTLAVPNSDELLVEAIRDHAELKGVLYRLERLTLDDSDCRPLLEWLQNKFEKHLKLEEEVQNFRI